MEVKFHAVKGTGHGRFNSPEVKTMVDDFFDGRLKSGEPRP